MVSVSAKRAYGGVAADERRAIRRTALMEAALDLFAEEARAGFQNEQYVLVLGSTIDTSTSTSPTLMR